MHFFVVGSKLNSGSFDYISPCMQGGEEILEVRLSSNAPTDLFTFEVQTGCLLSEPKHILLCPSAELAEELNRLPADQSLQDLTKDLSLLLSSSAEEEALSSLAKRYSPQVCQGDYKATLQIIPSSSHGDVCA